MSQYRDIDYKDGFYINESQQSLTMLQQLDGLVEKGTIAQCTAFIDRFVRLISDKTGKPIKMNVYGLNIEDLRTVLTKYRDTLFGL